MEMTNGKVDLNDLTGQSDIVLVCISAIWCGPCKTLSPILDEIQGERSDVRIFKIDADENQELCSGLQIRSVPTLLFYKKGVEFSRGVGLMKKLNITTTIEEIADLVDHEKDVDKD